MASIVANLVLAVMVSGLWWSTMAFPTGSTTKPDLVSLNIGEDVADHDLSIEDLSKNTAHTNCRYEITDTEPVLKSMDFDDWYPKRKITAKCKRPGCKMVPMKQLFLVKPKETTTYYAQWISWDTICSSENNLVVAEPNSVTRS